MGRGAFATQKLGGRGLGAFRSRLKTLAPGRPFARLSRESALFLPLVGAALSSSPLAYPPQIVGGRGLEPPRVSPSAPKADASASFAIRPIQ